MTAGLNADQLRVHIIRPALEAIGLWSAAAENLVLGTAMVESNLTYIRQIRGPALSIFQMEPATFWDIQNNYLRHQPELDARVAALQSGMYGGDHLHLELIGNLNYAAAMCRVFYRRIKAPLPAADDALALAKYHKQYYNTPLGKTVVAHSALVFARAVNA